MKGPIGGFQNPSGGRDPVPKEFADEAYAGLHAARGDYLQASLSVDMLATLTLPQRVLCDRTDSSRGELALDAVTNVGRISGLKAGRTYAITASIRESATASFLIFQWFNVTASALIGPPAVAYAVNMNATSSGAGPTSFIFTPLVDTEIELRITDAGSTADDVLADYTYVQVIEIGANVISAAGDYLLAELSADDVDPTIGDAIAFDTAVNERGGLSVDGAGKFSGLKAGRTYSLTANLRIFGGSSVSMLAQWHDVTGDVLLGVRAGLITPTSSSSASCQPTAVAVITPLVDTEVELRVTGKFSTPNVEDDDSFASITELGASPAPSRSLQSNLWYPPDIPNVNDVEFDTSTIPADWSWATAPVATEIDPYADITTGGPRVSFHSHRRSWLMMQPSNASVAQLEKSYTPPTNVLVWARLMFTTKNASPAENQNNVSIGLFNAADQANNRIEFYLVESDTGEQAANVVVVDNSAVDVNLETQNIVSSGLMQGQAFEYVAIHKIGLVYHFWVGTASGNWVWVTKHTWSNVNVIDSVMVQCASPTVISDPGNFVAGCDFIRFVESATLLP